MQSDEELMSAVAQGDLLAFDELVRRHQASAWRLAYRLLGRHQDAEDVAQEAFLRILRAASRYRPTAGFRTFLYRIITRLCRDRRRKAIPHPWADADAAICELPSPEECMEAREQRQAVREAVASLPPKQQEAVILRYYEMLSYSEIAQVLGTSPKGAERLLARGRPHLARLLRGFLGK